MTLFQRKIEGTILRFLGKNKILLLFGPRQSGKTTLTKKIAASVKDGAYYSCETNNVRQFLVEANPDNLLPLFEGGKQLIVLDEAQTVENIGKILKVFHDAHRDKQIIATGSSSFDLSNKINEPLTGRTIEFMLYPLSLEEIQKRKKTALSLEEFFQLLQYGSYPEVVGQETDENKSVILQNITTNYLYKDIFTFQMIRRPKIIEDLLKALSLQIGSLVSVHELSQLLKANSATIERYLMLLEQAFIVKRVFVYHTNKRHELRRPFKVYFLDLGIRNAYIPNLNPIEQRHDRGALFENWFFTELLKQHSVDAVPPRIYFWRNRKGLEIDFILEQGGEIRAYECKWQDTHVSFKEFETLYPQAITTVVTPELIVRGQVVL